MNSRRALERCVTPAFWLIKERLGLRVYETFGLLEGMWQIAAAHTKRGEIGRWGGMEAVLDWLEWQGSAGDIEAVLYEARTIEPCEPGGFRLRGYPGRSWLRLGTVRMRRRARILESGGDVTREQRAEVFARDGHQCRYCGSREDLTIDHRIPIAAGGKRDTENLQCLCRSCNSRKRDRIDG